MKTTVAFALLFHVALAQDTETTTPPLFWGDAAFCLALLLLIFLGMAIVCDDYLVPAMERLCEHLDIPEEAAGASFLAFGSAAPEILINVAGTAYGRVETSLSAVFGSAIIAYGLIPGLCTLMAPGHQLELSPGPILRDVGFFGIGLLCLSSFMEDAKLTMTESTTLCGLFFLYMLSIYIPILIDKNRDRYNRNHYQALSTRSQVSLSGIFKDSITPAHVNLKSAFDLAPVEESCCEETESSDRSRNWFSWMFLSMTEILSWPFYLVFGYTLPDCQEGSTQYRYYPLTLVFSIAYVAIFSEASLYLTRRIATDLAIAPSLAGVTLLALGSQVPDTIASVALAKNGMADGAVSNAIGSQVINVTLGSGVPFLIYNLFRGPLNVQVGDVNIISYCLVAVIAIYLIITLRGLCGSSIIGLTLNGGVALLVAYVLMNLVIIFTLK